MLGLTKSLGRFLPLLREKSVFTIHLSFPHIARKSSYTFPTHYEREKRKNRMYGKERVFLKKVLKTRSESLYLSNPHLTQCGFSHDVNGCECVHKKTLEPRLMKGPQKTVLYSILFSSSHVILACIGGHRRYITRRRRIERVAFAGGGGGG